MSRWTCKVLLSNCCCVLLNILPTPHAIANQSLYSIYAFEWEATHWMLQFPSSTNYSARRVNTTSLVATQYTSGHISFQVYVPVPWSTEQYLEERESTFHNILQIAKSCTRHTIYACPAARLISSAPSKLAPCKRPKAPATQASATLSRDTGGDKATCTLEQDR